MDENFFLIPIKRDTQQVLRRLCQEEGHTYDFMIKKLIDLYNELRDEDYRR